MKKLNILVYSGLFIALNVILSRFFSIQLPTLKISFGLIPIALSSIMFGPLIGGIIGGLSDFIGAILFPKGPYFPGFTLTAFLSGVIYGLFLYKKPKTILRISLCLITCTVLLNLGLNTLWVTLITKKGFMAVLGIRLLKDLILLPINVILVYTTWHYIGTYLHDPVFNKNK